MDGDGFYYCVGGRTAFGLRPAAPEHRGERFVQQRVGLHHLCFRARTREDVDLLYVKLVEWGARIVHAPEEGGWAPGYYSVLFEDPDGIRLELNFVPGKGLLAEQAARLRRESRDAASARRLRDPGLERRRTSPALVKYANNRRVSSQLRDLFPFPYSAEDAERFLERVAAPRSRARPSRSRRRRS